MLLATAAQPQTPAGSASIYSCVDAHGRTITADRPIPDCIDREQRVLNSSGTTARRIEPTYTPIEQAAREERARQAQLQEARLVEERRRDRALIVRYPNAAAHDRSRAEALEQIEAMIQSAQRRLEELSAERRKINDEMEFYQRDPSKAPKALQQRRADNLESAALQTRFIAEREEEKKRINDRFDEERTRLSKLWAQ